MKKFWLRRKSGSRASLLPEEIHQNLGSVLFKDKSWEAQQTKIGGNWMKIYLLILLGKFPFLDFKSCSIRQSKFRWSLGRNQVSNLKLSKTAFLSLLKKDWKSLPNYSRVSNLINKVQNQSLLAFQSDKNTIWHLTNHTKQIN